VGECKPLPDGSGRRCVAFLNEVDWRSETTNAKFYEFDEAGNEVSRRAFDYPASYVVRPGARHRPFFYFRSKLR